MAVENPLQDLIFQLQKMPGIGPKSAQRLAFFFLSLPKKDVDQFASVLAKTRHNIRYCDRCFNIAWSSRCGICEDENRLADVLCVVSEPRDILAIERIKAFHGRYHVLGGVISPIDGIHPETLRIQELMTRLRAEPVKELILAINPTVEGDATILYLTSLLQSSGIRITKLAYGLPIGSDIDYADDLTLQKSFLSRTSVE